MDKQAIASKRVTGGDNAGRIRGKDVKVARVHELGGPENFVIDEVPLPQPEAGEVRVKVHACGVNFGDSLLIAGKYQADPVLPFGPGGEVCGTITALGTEVVDLALGDRIICMPGLNGYAEEAIASASTAVLVPEGLDEDAAAAFPIAYGTSHMALWHKARLQPGETLVVHGAAGGVGLTAVEIGKAMGARVIATASSQEKLEIAQGRGADHLINSSTEDLRTSIKDLTDGEGADVIYDPIGGDTFAASLRAVRFEGRILPIGFAGGDIPQIPANIVMVKNIDILGINWPNYRKYRPDLVAQSFAILLGWLSEGKIRPLVSERFPLARTADAVRHVMERKAKGKVVVKPWM